MHILRISFHGRPAAPVNETLTGGRLQRLCIDKFPGRSFKEMLFTRVVTVDPFINAFWITRTCPPPYSQKVFFSKKILNLITIQSDIYGTSSDWTIGLLMFTALQACKKEDRGSSSQAAEEAAVLSTKQYLFRGTLPDSSISWKYDLYDFQSVSVITPLGGIENPKRSLAFELISNKDHSTRIALQHHPLTSSQVNYLQKP